MIYFLQAPYKDSTSTDYGALSKVLKGHYDNSPGFTDLNNNGQRLEISSTLLFFCHQPSW